MPHILQIYKTVLSIEKPDYNPDIRKRIGVWKEIQSTIGYCNNHTLYLPKELEHNSSILNADLIILQDSITFENKYNINDNRSSIQLQNNVTGNILFPNTGVKGFKNHDWPWRLELFDFKIEEDESINVWFQYDDILGIPKRDNHKIAALHGGHTIRYKVNGKLDFTLTGRKQRAFVECDYVMHYFGFIDRIDFVEKNNLEYTKLLPEQIYRIIDERKLLK